MKFEDAVNWLARGSADPSRNIDILRKILKNIIDHPKEEKYRRLARTNATLRALVFDGVSAPGAEDALRALGFVDDTENPQFFLLPMSKQGPSADVIRTLDTVEREEKVRREAKERKKAELEEYEAQKRKETLQKREEEWQRMKAEIERERAEATVSSLLSFLSISPFPLFPPSLLLSLLTVVQWPTLQKDEAAGPAPAAAAAAAHTLAARYLITDVLPM